MQQKFVIAALATLGLAACSSTGSLQSGTGDKISGTLTRGLIEPYHVEIKLDGKTYHGEWRTGAPTAEQKAAAGRPHRFHVGQVRSTLTAADGSKLDCQWQTHSETGEGTCTGNGREYPLVLK